jgi:hypothetical protein
MSPYATGLVSAESAAAQKIVLGIIARGVGDAS